MKLILLTITLIIIFMNTIPITISLSNIQIDMSQIIEIDNERSNGKAINTSNENIIVVEQYNTIFLHYIKSCEIKSIIGKEDATIEYFFNDDFKKEKNTLLIKPYIEKDYKVNFNCTDNPLIIKSLFQSKFDEFKINLAKIITQINTTTSDVSDKVNKNEEEREKDSKKLEELTNRTQQQEKDNKIEECKKRYKSVIRIIGIGYSIIAATGIFRAYFTKSKTLIQKWFRKKKVIIIIVAVIIWIFIIYFEFSKNPFFC